MNATIVVDDFEWKVKKYDQELTIEDMYEAAEKMTKLFFEQYRKTFHSSQASTFQVQGPYIPELVGCILTKIKSDFIYSEQIKYIDIEIFQENIENLDDLDYPITKYVIISVEFPINVNPVEEVNSPDGIIKKIVKDIKEKNYISFNGDQAVEFYSSMTAEVILNCIKKCVKYQDINMSKEYRAWCVDIIDPALKEEYK